MIGRMRLARRELAANDGVCKCVQHAWGLRSRSCVALLYCVKVRSCPLRHLIDSCMGSEEHAIRFLLVT